ncbi:MAG: hypothetical protein LBH16_10980 [Treponema sp.]|nr:hypothetical protein [Treponema sp.]
MLRNTAAAEITGREIISNTAFEYNRGSGFLGGMSAIGSLELNNMIKFKSGLSVDIVKNAAIIDLFSSAAYSPFKKIPLNFSFSHIYNGLPEYQAHTNSILQYVSFFNRYAGISIGLNLRFSSYFADRAQFESMLLYYGFFNIVNSDRILIGTGWGNFNDFRANNTGAYSYNIYSTVRINRNWFINNETWFIQSGGDGFASTFYGINWRTGAGFSW